MLPPGMSFNAISDKALAANKTSKLPKSFWAWDEMLTMNKIGFFPYTPATQMLQGLSVGIDMLHEEGLDNVFARHDRLAEATRRAVKAWGLENLNKNASQYSPTITAILLPEGHDADKFRALALETLQHLLRRELRRLCRQVFPHRPSRRHQRHHADRRARRHRDGARRSPAFRTRRAACRRRWII